MTEQELFLEALARPSPAERDVFLEQSCPDAAQRQRLRALLAKHAQADRRLDSPGADWFAGEAETPSAADPAERRAAAEAVLKGLLGPSDRHGALGKLGPHDVLAVLGRGGFGIVVKAFDNTLQRLVAIKVLDPNLAATSPPRKRFLREARAAALIAHENVVRVHSVQEQPIPYIVMELVNGPTLQEVLDANGPLEPADVARLGREIALGLAAAHANGLVHRDVKPANVLLGENLVKRALLTDFGLARAADDASLTQSGVLAGSPLYMAPEQVRGEALDGRSDLFALGSLLYTLCAGRPAFRASHPYAVLRRVVEDTPRALRDVAPDCPPGLVAVVERLMAKRPEGRFPSAEAAAAALGHCLTRPPRPARHRRRLAALGGALALAGLVALAWPPAPPKSPITPPAAPPDPLALVVTSVADGEQAGTLRWAVREANRRSGEQTITFDPAAFAAPQTITLTAGPLVLTDSARTTIVGSPTGVVVSGDDRAKVFVIGGPQAGGATAELVNLTVAHARANAESPYGGGVYVASGSTVALVGCTLRDNTVAAEGGAGLYVHSGAATLTNCTIARNSALEAAAVKNYNGIVTLINCTIAHNQSERAAAVYTLGSPRARTTVYNSLVAENSELGLYAFDGATLEGDHNVSGDNTAPGPNSIRNAAARLGQLGPHGGPTETIPLLADSPALDAGANAHLPAAIATDQLGSPRVANGRVDVGAVEVR